MVAERVIKKRSKLEVLSNDNSPDGTRPASPLSVSLMNDPNNDLACHCAVVSIQGQHRFQCNGKKICVPGFTSVIFKMSDHFFLPLIMFVIYFYSACEERGKLGFLLIPNQCFNKYLEQSMSLSRISRGDNLLFKLNEP